MRDAQSLSATQGTGGTVYGDKRPGEAAVNGGFTFVRPHDKTTLRFLVLLLLLYAATYGWILISTGFMPYVMDNNESFSVLLHASNMYHFSFWKSLGLTDEAYGPNPAAHPFIHTHQGNMPRLFGFLIYVLGARSIESQILVTTATIGTLSVVLMYFYFVRLAGSLFAFICSSLVITDYVMFMQWQVVTYRVWYSLLFFLSLLCIHGMAGPRRRMWKWLLTCAYLLLFYFELVFAGLMTVFCGLYTLMLHRRDLPVAKAIFATQFKVAAAAIVILFAQLSMVFGPSVVVQDFRLTFFSRNDSGGLAMQRVKEFFGLHDIVYWDNSFDGTSIRNHVELIRSQTHFNFQVYTPILTLISVILLLAWLLEHWRSVGRAVSTVRGAVCSKALRTCWFLIVITLAPWSLALWLQSGRNLTGWAVLGVVLAAVFAGVTLRHGPAAVWQLYRLRAEDPVRVNAAIRVAGSLCAVFLLLQLHSSLSYRQLLAGSAALLSATRAFYVVVLLGMVWIALQTKQIMGIARFAKGAERCSGAIDQSRMLRTTAVISLSLLGILLLALRMALWSTIRVLPWLTLYLVFALAFVLFFFYWNAWTQPIHRLRSHLSQIWSSENSLDAVRLSAAIAAGFLIPFALPLLDAKVEKALIFKSYPAPYFVFLCLYIALCIVVVRCALNPALVSRWLQRINPGEGPLVAAVPERLAACDGGDDKTEPAGAFAGVGDRLDRRFSTALKVGIVFFLLFYVLTLIIAGQNVFGTTPSTGASIWTFPWHALPVIVMAAAGTLAVSRLGGRAWMEFDHLTPGLVSALAVYLFAIGNFIQHHWEWYEQEYSATWMETAKFRVVLLLGKLTVLLAVALGMGMILLGSRRALGQAGVEGLRRIGTFFLLGELAYAVIYVLSPGYVLTGYQQRYAPFSVFFTCVIPAMAVYILLLTTARAWNWFPEAKEVSSVPDFPKSRFGQLLPRFIGGSAAAGAVFFCAYWVIIQVTYIRLLPPDHFSFLKRLRQPPYRGKSFVVNNYAAPVAVMAGAWAYFDPLMTTGWKRTGSGYETPWDTRYLWLADRWKNKSYEKPDYYVCMIGQNLPWAAAKLKDPETPLPYRCSVQGLVANVIQGNVPAIDYRLAGTEGGKTDSWAIVKLDYEYPPYLEQLGPDLRAGVNLSVDEAREQALRPRVEYRFQQVNHEPEANSLLELYAAENNDCDNDHPEWRLIYQGASGDIPPLPIAFTGKLQAFVTPRTRHKEGWRFHSAVLHVIGKDVSSVKACASETPAPPSGLHAFRADSTTIELDWRGSPGAVRYRVEMARGDEPMETLGQIETSSGVHIVRDAATRLPYRFKVAACEPRTGACSWPTPTVTEEMPRKFAPEPVTHIRAYRLSAQTVYLEWFPAPYARDYLLEMRVKGGEFEEVARADKQSSRELIDDLEPQREYSFRVRACRQDDCAEYSTEVPIGRNATLLPPARIQVARRDPAVAVLSWKGGEPMDHYRIDMALGQAGEFQQIGTVTRRSEYTVRNMVPRTSYRFRIRSCLHAQGPCSAYSPIVVSAPGQ